MRVYSLFNEVDVLWFTLALQWDVLHDMDPSIDKGLFREETLENQLSVVEIHAMEILSLDFLLT